MRNFQPVNPGDLMVRVDGNWVRVGSIDAISPSSTDGRSLLWLRGGDRLSVAGTPDEVADEIRDKVGRMRSGMPA